MISKERNYRIPDQHVVLNCIDSEGWILDIGGGGEGVIGQLMGDRVVAIDPIKRELEEAATGPLKIVMDARELQFLDNTFPTVTAFFSFMFMAKQDHRRVLGEIYRVMKPGGYLHVWDVTIPPYDNHGRDVYIIPLKVNIPGKMIDTGYGCLWPQREQNAEYFIKLAQEAGFAHESVYTEGKTFYLIFKRDK